MALIVLCDSSGMNAGEVREGGESAIVESRMA